MLALITQSLVTGHGIEPEMVGLTCVNPEEDDKCRNTEDRIWRGFESAKVQQATSNSSRRESSFQKLRLVCEGQVTIVRRAIVVPNSLHRGL